MSTKINKIKIENFKGISNLEIDFDGFHPNRLNLLVAPNGFGKSSLAACFDNLKQGHLKISEDYFHNDDQHLQPLLLINAEINGTKCILQADKTRNDISKLFEVSVIKSKVCAITRQGWGDARATSRIGHEDLILVSNIPVKVDFNYKKSEFQRIFPKHKREVIPLIEFLNDQPRFSLWLWHFSLHDKLLQAKPGKNQELIEEELKKDVALIDFALMNQNIEEHEASRVIWAVLLEYVKVDLERLMLFYQIVYFVRLNKKELLDYCRHILYKKWKEKVKGTISLLKTSKYEAVSLVENDGKLKFKLLNFEKLSNGQRDVASFLAQLYAAEYDLIYDSKKDFSFLIIDEVFDYLDDANIVSCQYFVAKFVDSFKYFSKSIFPLVLTHLSPSGFDSFKSQKMKAHFLKKRTGNTKEVNIRRIVLKRSGREITEADKDNISKYFLHYHIVDQTKLPPVGLEAHVKSSHSLHSLSLKHMKRYLDGQTDFDPFSVCTSLRVELEKYVYNLIEQGNDKSDFLLVHGTSEKFSFAEEKGTRVPEIFYLLGIIYNEGLHAKDDRVNFIESKIVSQLENQVIFNLIKKCMVEICKTVVLQPIKIV